MLRRALIFLLFLIVLSEYGFSQRGGGDGPVWYIGGKVIDSVLKVPIEYASVILYSQSDSVRVTGNTTDSDGKFQLEGRRPGLFYIEVSFIGYNSNHIDNIFLQRGINQIDIGEIKLVQSVLSTDDVEIEIDKVPLEYKIDKKVVNVDKIYTASSGSAVDVLENVPSVSVDIEGNVQLRGNSNFTVLIDGRPSVLDATEALEQIPASSIDNIEIITNPSAKYDPDGTSGIINIVMKKNQMSGAGGIVNLNTGSFENYGGDFLLNYKRGNVNASFGADYSIRNFPGSSKQENWTDYQGVRTYVNSDGSRSRNREAYGIRGILEIDLTPKDNLGLGFRYGGRDMKHDSELDYSQWTYPATDSSEYLSVGKSNRSGYFYAGNLDYRHNFPKKGHVFTASIHGSYRKMEEESTNELREPNGTLINGQLSTEDGPGDRLQYKLEYIYPFSETNKFEAGAQGRTGYSEDITSLSQYDTSSNTYILEPEYNNKIGYTRDIYSVYTLYSGETGKIGYQGGLRGEYTYRIIDLIDSASFKIDRWDYFPSAHFSYEVAPQRQFMASYSRRIERARGWYLEPFLTWEDAYTVRKGNPDLKPEYIDSYEIGHQNHIGDNFISIEGYYRITHNLVERVRSVFPDTVNVILNTIENVGTGYAGGVEIMTTMEPVNWWSFNLMGNLFNNRIKGVIFGEPFSNESFQWDARFNNSFKLRKTTKFQVNVRYHSPSVTSQGDSKAFFVLDLALKQEFMKGQLSATLQLNNVLGTAKHELTYKGTDFYSYRYFDRDYPFIMLNLNYNINNYKPERKKNGEINGLEEDDF